MCFRVVFHIFLLCVSCVTDEGSVNCCASNVLEDNNLCGNGVEAPCVIENYTPAPAGVPGENPPFGACLWRVAVVVAVAGIAVVVFRLRSVAWRLLVEALCGLVWFGLALLDVI